MPVLRKKNVIASRKIEDGSALTTPVLIALVAAMIVALIGMAIVRAIPKRWLI